MFVPFRLLTQRAAALDGGVYGEDGSTSRPPPLLLIVLCLLLFFALQTKKFKGPRMAKETGCTLRSQLIAFFVLSMAPVLRACVGVSINKLLSAHVRGRGSGYIIMREQRHGRSACATRKYR